MTDPVPDSLEWVALGPGEQLRLATEPSAKLVLAGLGVGSVLVVAMSVGVEFVSDLATGRVVSLATLVFVVLLVGSAYAVVRTRQYVLTSDRALVAVGLRRKRTTTLALDAVEEVRVRQPTWQRLLGTETVELVAGDGRTIEFGLVANPRDLRRQIQRFATGGELGPTAG
jgi:uncharacterized membrane protein YdbT with pleckstrin-like domain